MHKGIEGYNMDAKFISAAPDSLWTALLIGGGTGWIRAVSLDA
jgi:hypothetical protein